MNNELSYLIYNTPEEDVSVRAVVKDETIWLTQKAMSELFGCSADNISLHLKNIFSDGELDKNSVIEKISATAADGKKYLTQFYNLDAIISVGYRVNSRKATNFRIWATSVLKEYMIKGFAMDDERLKQGKTAFGKDYFRELLERVRSIRASERRIWLQITDIFAECSIDYDKNANITKEFYAMVQNKFHYAITGKTASEIINTSADRAKDHMGLTTWKEAPDGKIMKSDVVIAKNYLSQEEMTSMEYIVSAYLDLAENRARRHIPMTMEDWAKRLDIFLEADEHEVLKDSGKITAEIAKEHAETEFEKYRVIQDRLFMSDFDKFMIELEEKAKTK